MLNLLKDVILNLCRVHIGYIAPEFQTNGMGYY